MGGGNAQKTAASRAKHAEKDQASKAGGGGKSAMIGITMITDFFAHAK